VAAGSVTVTAIARRVDQLAEDVGRLIRYVDGDSYPGVLACRIAEHVEWLDALVRPTAHEMYVDNLVAGMTEQDAITRALAAVDTRTAKLARLFTVRQSKEVLRAA
jgi:hypothetical protein